MTIETNKREMIAEYYRQNPTTNLMASEVGLMFDFMTEASHKDRGEVVRGIKKRVIGKMTKWTEKSKWEVQKKGGVTETLTSWKTDDKADYIDKLKAVKELLFEELAATGKAHLSDIKYNQGSVLAEINLPDYHFGKADGRTLEEQCADYIAAVKLLTERIKGFKIDKFLLVIGNDMFHIDNANKTTTKGTKVECNAEWDEIFAKGTATVIHAIEYLLRYNSVDVVCVQGNHDFTLSFTAGEAIKYYFHNYKTVEVHNGVNEPRKYYQYGSNLLGYTHGDKEKPQDLPLIMAVEQPVLFGICPHRYFKIGHVHHAILKDYQGVEIETLPSLSRVDRWHKVHGYLSKPKALVSIYDKEDGKIGQFMFNNY